MPRQKLQKTSTALRNKTEVVLFKKSIIVNSAWFARHACFKPTLRTNGSDVDERFISLLNTPLQALIYHYIAASSGKPTCNGPSWAVRPYKLMSCLFLRLTRPVEVDTAYCQCESPVAARGQRIRCGPRYEGRHRLVFGVKQLTNMFFRI